MPAPAAQCRGFTHPVLLLIRSSVQPAARRPSSTFFTATRAPQCVSSRASLGPARLFTTARILRSQAKPRSSAQTTAKPAGGSKAAPRTRPAPATASSADSYVQRLAQNPQGTVLYEGAPQKVFVASSYAAGLSCMLGAALDVHYNVFNVPPGVPEWTAYAFGSVGLMMAILGMSFALKPANVVRQIRVLPTAPGSSKVQLEVVSRRLTPIPGLPYRREVVEPRDVVLRTRTFAPRPSAAETRAQELEWARRRQEQARYDEDHRMTIPFRDAKAAAETVFTSLRRGLTGEGFAAIDVRGQRYKLDVQNGYVHEGGRALDRIVRFEPEESRAHILFRK
jgi:hypothetical protein